MRQTYPLLFIFLISKRQSINGKEFDTYKVGTVANSCSTMHKIQEKEFDRGDFSYEHIPLGSDAYSDTWDFKTSDMFFPINVEDEIYWSSEDVLDITIQALNHYRNKYLEAKDKKYWWQMIQLLPSSYNQTRNVMMNYEVLANIYKSRKDHKLDEWREFCKWIEALPYSELIIGFREYDAVEYGKEHPEFVEKIQKAAKGESDNE